MGERKKIWHITAGGEQGGAKTHILSLLPKLAAGEFEVRLVCLNCGPLAAEGEALGLPVTVLPMPRAWDLRVVYQLAHRLRQERVSLVHTHGVRANFCGRLSAHLAGVPLVVTTVHSLVSLDYHSRWHSWLSSTVDRATRPLTRCFVAVSEALGRHLVQSGIPADQVAVIVNGLEPPLAPADPPALAAVRAELGIGPDEAVVGVVGRLVPVKAYDDFLRAAALVTKERPATRFLVIGDGPCAGALQELAHSLGIADRVVFTGFRRDVPALLPLLDVFVLSSLSEGLPLVLLEAMAAGRPVVSTAVGGVPEVIDNGVNGYLSVPQQPEELAGQILRVLGDPGLAHLLGENAQRRVQERFGIGRMVAATERLYRDLLAGARQGG